MNPNQALADSRVFNFDAESLRRGLAMTPTERALWVEEMMLLGFEVEARRARELAARGAGGAGLGADRTQGYSTRHGFPPPPLEAETDEAETDPLSEGAPRV